MTAKMTPAELAVVDAYRARPRLLYEAAAFVETIPDAQFQMGHWWLTDGMAFDDDRNVMFRVADGPCGCAVGHLVQMGMYGLGPDLLTQSRDRIFVVLGEVFGIGSGRAEFLFDQYAYGEKRDRAAVAARMRFIADEALT